MKNKLYPLIICNYEHLSNFKRWLYGDHLFYPNVSIKLFNF